MVSAGELPTGWPQESDSDSGFFSIKPEIIGLVQLFGVHLLKAFSIYLSEQMRVDFGREHLIPTWKFILLFLFQRNS